MGSTIQEEMKRQMEKLAAITATKTESAPAPATVMDEQRKLAGISAPAPEKKKQMLTEDTSNWKLDHYARSVASLCEDLENKLQNTLRGLEQYKVSGQKEASLKPGKNLKDLKGAAKELQSKIIQARRIASGIECELGDNS